MFKKFGNSFFWIQHVQIRLEHISKHFYQKMPSQVTFSGFPASLFYIFIELRTTAVVCSAVTLSLWLVSLFSFLSVSNVISCH